MDLELGKSGPWVRVRHGPEMQILAPNCWSRNTYPKTYKQVAGKTGEWKKLENLVQNRSIGNIVGARPTAERQER